MPGFSEGYRDAWFVGYTPKLLAGVWVGYDNSQAIGSKDVAVHSAVPLLGRRDARDAGPHQRRLGVPRARPS